MERAFGALQSFGAIIRHHALEVWRWFEMVATMQLTTDSKKIWFTICEIMLEAIGPFPHYFI
jgi:hypothetical protein